MSRGLDVCRAEPALGGDGLDQNDEKNVLIVMQMVFEIKLTEEARRRFGVGLQRRSCLGGVRRCLEVCVGVDTRCGVVVLAVGE